MLVIGVDEAGYGPNLGPLTIGLTAWRSPEGLPVEEFYQALASGVRQTIENDARIAIADSKAIYQPATGLGQLERSVLALLAASEVSVASILDLWNELRADPDQRRRELPWHDDLDDRRELPGAASPEAISLGAARLREATTSAGVEWLGCRAAAVFPSEFNEGCERWGGKGAVLTHETLALITRALAEWPDEQVCVLADKHGGRNRYASALQFFFPDAETRIECESRPRSDYLLTEGKRTLRFRFSAKGETLLPTAAASLVAKYLRETAMAPFNRFWAVQVQSLRPTAGYPVDARRFWDEIAPVRATAGVCDDALWRRK